MSHSNLLIGVVFATAMALGAAETGERGHVDTRDDAILPRPAMPINGTRRLRGARALQNAAECSASQKDSGCCNPFGGGELLWQFQSSSDGGWTSSSSMIRFDFADDTKCGGTATSRQTGTAWASLDLTGTAQISLSMSGVAEANYEKFVLLLDSVTMATVQATNGQGGSSCQVGTCTMCDVSMNAQTLTITPGLHELRVDVDSMDSLYHKGAHFEVMFSSLDSTCGGCTCSPPTEAPTKTPTKLPTNAPTKTPTMIPTEVPTTVVPTPVPTIVPTTPTAVPTAVPTIVPTIVPTTPTTVPTTVPTTKACDAPQSKKECKEAAAAHGLSWDGTRRWSDRLPGCLRTVADSHVNWNKDDNGQDQNADQIPLCKA